MSDDWRVGDLALCVDDARRRYSGPPTGLLRKGKVYRVIGIAGPNLIMAEGPVGDDLGWRSDRFRKIRPDEHQACEPEFVTLLESFKPKVDASLTDFVVVVSSDGVASIAA